MEVWRNKLARTNPFVALNETQIVGFVELEDSGHIHFFYCHHEWQRKGVGTALLHAAESRARSLSLPRLFAEVSTTAVEFFKSKGFSILKERAKIISGAPARQFVMEKRLT